jgi:hypothetical protein
MNNYQELDNHLFIWNNQLIIWLNFIYLDNKKLDPKIRLINLIFD